MTIHHDDAFRLATLQLDHLRESAATARLRRRLRRRTSVTQARSADHRELPAAPTATPRGELRSVHR